MRNIQSNALNVLGALYGPSASKLARECVDIGDTTAAQLATLAADPSPERCERVAVQLEGVRQHVNRLRDQLQRETIGETK